MAATSQIRIISILVLRILILLLLAASIVVMCLNNFKLSDGSKVSFTSLLAYRYVVAVAATVFMYTLIQLPFVAYEAFSQKRFTRNGCLPWFDFYGDKVMSYLLATGVGVGFGVIVELKLFLKDVFNVLQTLKVADVDEFRSKDTKFLDKGIISTCILLVAFLLMVLISLLTSINRSEKGGFFR